MERERGGAFEGGRQGGSLALPHSGWLSDYSQVDLPGLRYEPVNFAAGKSPRLPNFRLNRHRHAQDFPRKMAAAAEEEIVPVSIEDLVKVPMPCGPLEANPS